MRSEGEGEGGPPCRYKAGRRGEKRWKVGIDDGITEEGKEGEESRNTNAGNGRERKRKGRERTHSEHDVRQKGGK